MAADMALTAVRGAYSFVTGIIAMDTCIADRFGGHRESGERQYALVGRAASLGWSAGSIKTIDEDQGRTGTTATHRGGFQNLLTEIAASHVGIVLALEASRLARSSADWHRLVEICALT